jgi:hypothetical protein
VSFVRAMWIDSRTVLKSGSLVQLWRKFGPDSAGPVLVRSFHHQKITLPRPISASHNQLKSSFHGNKKAPKEKIQRNNGASVECPMTTDWTAMTLHRYIILIKENAENEHK